MHSNNDAWFVFELSKFFRSNEKEILNGRKKLSLTSSVLCTLNRIFISDNFCDNQNEDVKKNLQYLKNFINNTIALKILHNAETVQGGINLSAFQKLWMLELKKIPIHLLLGIHQLQTQVEILVCSGSVSYLQEFSVNGTSSGWIALKHLNLSHNYLEKLEESIKLFPNLETLNVSHNKLKSSNGLQYLNKLNAVNLGYNHLEKVPVFNNDVYYSLKNLSLRNNNIEDLTGLDNLQNLENLDLSYNCISDHLSLQPLNRLPYLKMLNLVGNPLVLHQQYKILTIKNLHLNVCTVGLYLDNYKLTKKEMLNIRKIKEISPIQCENDVIQINISEEDKNILDDLDTPSVIYKIADAKRNNINDDDKISKITENSLQQSKLSTPKLKKREQNVIANAEYDNSDNTSLLNCCKESTEQEQHYDNSEIKTEDNQSQDLVISGIKQLETDIKSSSDVNLKIEEDQIMLKEEPIPVPESYTNDDIEILLPKVIYGGDDIYSENDIYEKSNEYCENTYKEMDNEEDTEANIYLLEKESEGNKLSVFVSIGKQHLKEKNILTSCILDSLDLRVLESVEKCGEQTLHLKFNMLKKSRRERIYHAENKDIAEKLFKTLKFYIDDHYLKNITENILMCLKCEARFSQRKATQMIITDKKLDSSNVASSYDSTKENLKQIDSCPNCGSLMVFKDDNHSNDELQNYKDLQKHQDSLTSNSNDIKSDVLTTENSSKLNIKEVSKISNKYEEKDKKIRSSSFDYSTVYEVHLWKQKQQSLISNEHADSISVKSNNSGESFQNPLEFKRSSSDITVLSNPSQSSIAVIAESEFDQDVRLNSPLDDENFCNLLTSSVRLNAEYAAEKKDNSRLYQVHSSSDSETSSVCTALENNSGFSNNIYNNTFLKTEKKNINNKENSCILDINTNIQPKENKMHYTIRDDQNENNSKLFESIKDKSEISKQIIDNLININHTLKLHLELKLFDLEEEFKIAVEVFMVSHNTLTMMICLMVLSSKRIYFLKLEERFKDEPENSVTVLEKKNLNQLNSVNVLLGNQGVSLIWDNEKYYTCLFKDADYCNCFITYFTDFIRENKNICPVIQASIKTCLQQIIQDVFLTEVKDGDHLMNDIDIEVSMFFLIEKCFLEKVIDYPVAVISSIEEICIAEVIFTKLSKSNKAFHPIENYKLITKQKITNIISVHLCLDLCKIGFHFLDEDTNQEFCWLIYTKTRTTLFSMFNTIKELWEKQFGIELTCNCFTECTITKTDETY